MDDEDSPDCDSDDGDTYSDFYDGMDELEESPYISEDLDSLDDMSLSDSEIDESADANPSIDLLEINPQMSLLVTSPKAGKEPYFPHIDCSNVILHSNLWAKDQDFGLMATDMGFLDQLAHICIHSRIRQCLREDCNITYNQMQELAPQCDWVKFRNWALTAMSCQATMNDDQKVSKAHTHIASAVSSCCMLLRRCTRGNAQDTYTRMRPHLDGFQSDSISLESVTNLIYWMARIQSDKGIGPAKLGHWNHHFLAPSITLSSIQRAMIATEQMHLCKNRIWNLVKVSDRKQSDLPDILAALQSQSDTIRHPGHKYCTPSKCQWAHMDTTGIQQIHKCSHSSGEIACESDEEFPLELLETNLELGKSTAWLCKKRQLCGAKDPYVAISHVWSDGTGAGNKPYGTVNPCLFDFFAKISERLGCKGIWWDVISVPSEQKARDKALKNMHYNYADAKCTIVHDRYLLNIPWKDDGSPCLALVLSPWFTRAWTALELAKSNKVKVLFKGSNNGPVLKDLDSDILAKSPDRASRAYWLATTLIKQLRSPIEDVGDLLAILSPRSTAKLRDRTVVAALLADVPDFESLGSSEESLITRSILRYLGKIPSTCLLHGKPTMCDLGPFSWSAATLDDMPVDISKDMEADSDEASASFLKIDERGAVEGIWWCRPLLRTDVEKHNIQPHGNSLASVVKVQAALCDWNSCLLMRYSDHGNEPLALLVVPHRVLKLKQGPVLYCRYIGTVNEDRTEDNVAIGDENSPWTYQYYVRIGGSDSGTRMLCAVDALQEYDKFADEFADGNNGECSDSDAEPSENDNSGFPQIVRDTSSEAFHPEWLNRAAREQTPASEERPETIVPLNTQQLRRALKRRDKYAASHLIENKVRFSSQELARLPEDLGSAGHPRLKACSSIAMLGHVLAQYKDFTGSIEAFHTAESEWNRMDWKLVDDLFERFSAKYALGLAHMETTTDNGLHEAETAFNEILEKCSLKVSEQRKRAHKNSSAQVNDGSGHAEARNVPTTQIKHAVKIKGKESQGRADAWYRLGLNTISQLTMIYITQREFKKAAETYRRALHEFGKLPQNDEVFLSEWHRWERHPYDKKFSQYDQAAKVYSLALKRFESLFRKKHQLVLVTYLHLGVNCMLRSDFKGAERRLGQAVKGLRAHTNTDSNPNGSEESKHPLLGLALYYQGVLHWRERRHKKSIKEFHEALSLAPIDPSHWLRPAALLGLAATYINDREPDIDKAETRLASGNVELMKAPPTLHRRLRIQALKLHVQVSLGRKDYSKAVDHCNSAIKSLKENIPFAKNDRHDMDLSECRLLLGEIFSGQKQFAKAKVEVLTALEGLEKLEGTESISYLDAQKQLSSICSELKEHDEAISRLDITTEGYTKILGVYHPKSLKTKCQLGRLYHARNNLKDANTACSTAYNGFERTKGKDNRFTMEAAQTLGRVYFDQGKFSQAREMFFKVHVYLARLQKEKKKQQDAESNEVARQQQEIHEQQHSIPNDESHQTNLALAWIDLARVSVLLDGPGEIQFAETLYREAIESLQSTRNTESVHLGNARLSLGDLYTQAQKYREANELIQNALESFKRLESASNNKEFSDKVAEAKWRQCCLQLAERHTDGSDTNRGESDTIEEIERARDSLVKYAGASNDVTLEASEALGRRYLDDPELREDGELLLKDVLEQYCSRLTPGHSKIVKIMDRLISHYRELDRADDISEMKKKKWEALRDGYGFDHAVVIWKMTDVEPTRNEVDILSDDDTSSSGSSLSFGEDFYQHSGPDSDVSSEGLSEVEDSESSDEVSEWGSRFGGSDFQGSNASDEDDDRSGGSQDED